MTTTATAIREAIYSRLSTLPGYAKVRRELTPQLQPSDLPCLSIAIVSEDMVEDGDANTGEPHFITNITIGISVARGFDNPVTLAGEIDSDVDAIETKLLTDPSFVPPSTSYPPPVEAEPALFEAVTRITRRREYPFDGEAYFCELRLEVTFETRIIFIPLTPDEFQKVRMTSYPIGHPDAPIITSEFELDQ
jgi:hypothetical protein